MLGVWPEGNAEFATPSEYRNKWGFSGIVISASHQSSYDNVVSTGYPKENILVTLPSYATLNTVYSAVDRVHSERYYIDEPLERLDYSINDLIDIANYITSKYPSSMLILSSYTMPNGWYAFPVYTFGEAYGAVMNANSNVGMMCDQYSEIQESMWNQFKTSYNNKYYGNFIASKDDYGEYNSLISKANSIGINSLFLYNGSYGWPTKTPEFCDAAFMHGWLRKFAKKYRYWYHCPSYFGDPCWCRENLSGWELDHIQYMGITEVYP